MTRATRNAAMVRAYGRDSWTPPAPMSEARRRHLHGDLLPMDDKLPGDGELQWLLPWITLASGSIVALVIWSIFA